MSLATADPTVGTLPVRAFATGFGPARSTAPVLPAAVRWSFYLFVLTVPFEAAQLPFMTGSLSLAKISGLALAASFLFFFNPVVKSTLAVPVRGALWLFCVYFIIYVLIGVITADKDIGRFISAALTRLQLLVLFAIVATLLKDSVLARHFCLLFIAGSTLLAVAMSLNLFGIVPVLPAGDEERLTALGYNFNTIAGLLALATIMALGLLIKRVYSSRLANLVLLGALLPLLKGMVATGSRSGIMTAAVGCLVYVIALRGSQAKIASVAVLIIGVGAAAYFTSADTVLSRRLEKTYQQSDSSGRNLIYPAALRMAVEKPLFGWGPFIHWSELGRRTASIWSIRDEHNMLLFLLLEVGLAGTIPFLSGLALIVRKAWRGRSGGLGMIPMALLAGLAVNNMVENGLGPSGKLFWLMMALGAAAMPALRARRWVPIERMGVS